MKKRRRAANAAFGTTAERVDLTKVGFLLPEEDYQNLFEWGGRLRQYVIKKISAYPPAADVWLVADRLEQLLDEDPAVQKALAQARKRGYKKLEAVRDQVLRVFSEKYLVEYVDHFLRVLPKIADYVVAKDAWKQAYPEHFREDGEPESA